MDGRWLFTAPYENRAKWPSERRNPVYSSLKSISARNSVNETIKPKCHRQFSSRWSFRNVSANYRLLSTLLATITDNHCWQSLLTIIAGKLELSSLSKNRIETVLKGDCLGQQFSVLIWTSSITKETVYLSLKIYLLQYSVGTNLSLS